MTEKLKILILEDVEEDAGLIDRTLTKENIAFTRVRVETRDEFNEALTAFNPDIILSDHSLPQFNSIEALDICKKWNLDVPFILVTGAVSEEFAVSCLKRGADDYILKSNLSRLPMAIQHALRQHQSENHRVKQEILLREQNEELTKINQELDSFVYSISHNLRSPLSSVLGLVNVAKLDCDTSLEKSKNYFQLIEKSVLKLDETLHEILDYSQNARTDLEITEIDIKKLINQSCEQMQYLNCSESVAKLVEVHQDAPFYSDAHRLSIIFNNLLSNAVKYRDRTKTTQSIRITANINPVFASIDIHDNGIGIAKEHMPHLFNMFFRATERSEGAGLGLYIVKEMIAKLKGTINISSVLYQETSVLLTLPNVLVRN